MLGDLHCHTTASDGSLSPTELIKYASRAGIGCVGVTDHDTMAGTAEAVRAGKDNGVEVIEGIEVSTWDGVRGRKAHLICYFPSSPEKLKDMCDRTLAARDETARKAADAISSKYPIDYETARRFAGASTAVFKQHIVYALAQMGYTLSVFGDLFTELFGKDGICAGIHTKYPDTREAMSLIREAGGLSVLAHPGLYGSFELIEELCAMGLEGIEVHHPRQSEQDEAIAWEAADCYGLMATGGSDFHGMFASEPTPLGARTAPPETVDALLRLCGREK